MATPPASLGPVGRPAPGAPGSVITPQAVVIDLRTASAASRAAARVIDLIAVQIGVTVLSIPVALLDRGGTASLVLTSFLLVLGLFGYPAFLEARWRGRTLGKAALGLRVVTADGGPIGARQALVRSLLFPIDLVAGLESMLLSPRDRRIGDVLAGTVVRRESKVGRSATPTWFAPPPGLEVYTASLDTVGLTPGELVLVRSLLLRWSEITPTARWPAAAALAGPILARLGHRTLPGLPPELYLQCLLAARQARDNGIAVPQPPPPMMWGPPAPGSLVGTLGG